MAVDLADQFFVEKDRNLRYEFLLMFVSLMLPIAHGVVFVWVPFYLRNKRKPEGLTHEKYFALVRDMGRFTRTFSFKIWRYKFYFQPSLLVVAAFHFMINCIFAFVHTADLDYEPRYYVVSKRIGRIGVACIPPILIFVAKNDFFSTLSGLSLEKSVFFHKWLGRFMFIAITVHMVLALKYWLDMQFYIMIQIPPQIFGMISYGCLGMLNILSFKFIRNFAFDFFLTQHRVFNFIMLLLAFFHSGGNKAAVILGVHMLVLDRIVSLVIGLIHKYKGPTRGLSEFEVLDEDTIRISIPIKVSSANPDRWFWFLVPRYGQWRAGQHVLLNVASVNFFQHHPFTICSLPSNGKVTILMKVRKGFTRRLLKKINKKKALEDEEISATSSSSVLNSLVAVDSPQSGTKLIFKEEECKLTSATPTNESLLVYEFLQILHSFQSPQIVKMKAGFKGPFGGRYQPLTKFESVLFFGAGSGCAFTLPVALDLLQKLKALDEADDYLYRPAHTAVTIVACFKKLRNVQWFDHLWPEFVPFLDSGRAHLILHITQESTPPSLAALEKQEKSAKVETEVSEKTMHQTASLSDVFTESTSGVSTIYGRPDIMELVVLASEQLCDPNYRKAIACLGCGPEEFNDTLSAACRSSRKLASAPDVYCYTESFDS